MTFASSQRGVFMPTQRRTSRGYRWRLALSGAAFAGALVWARPAAPMVWPNAIDRFERTLQQGDVAQRREAAKRLSSVPHSALSRLLPLALRDEDREVRLRAAELAIAARFVPATFEAQQWLTDSDPRVRRAAADVLGAFPLAPAALQALGRALGDSDLDVRLAAVRALGDSAEPDAALALLGHIDDSNAKVQVAVIDALAKIGGARSVVPLIGKVQDARAAVRRAAANALGVLGGERVVSALVLALADSDARVRLAAVSALGKQRARDASEALLSVAKGDRETEVQIAAIEALGRIDTVQAAAQLVSLLGVRRRELREASERALSAMGTVAAGALQGCLESSSQSVRLDGCARALAQADPTGAAAVLARAWRSKTISAEAALVSLASSADESALPLVLEALLHGDPWVRRQAVEAAWSLLNPANPDGRAVEPILTALERPGVERQERLALIGLLGRTGSERAREALTLYAASESPVEFRIAAIQGLGWIAADTHSERQLLAALTADGERLRWEAALATRRAGRGELAEALLAQLDAQPPSARELLLLALWGPAGRRSDDALAQAINKRIRAATGAERDALVEILLRVNAPLVESTVRHWLKDGEPALRAKLAETLANRAWGAALLRQLVEDPTAAVRANAVWSLGQAGDAQDVAALLELLSDRDVSVAANAAASVVRLTTDAERDAVSGALCQVLPKAPAYVRVNALLGLARLGAACQGQTASWLLTHHPVSAVRQAAAAYHQSQPEASAWARDALRRCATHDIDADVARTCEQGPPWAPQAGEALTVFVVPDSHVEPVPNAPFALRVGDGFLRLGWADRRGALSEYSPRGSVQLEVPAQLVE